MVTITVDDDALERDLVALLHALEAAVYRGLDSAAEMHAAEARSRHWYRNRTGDLEASTRAYAAEGGSVWNDDVQATVAATEPYAHYVDARSPILEPAWQAVEAQATASLEAILEEAAARG